MRNNAYIAFHVSFSLISYNTQHMPRGGITHSELVHDISVISQELAKQDFPWANLVQAFCQFKFLLPTWYMYSQHKTRQHKHNMAQIWALYPAWQWLPGIYFCVPLFSVYKWKYYVLLIMQSSMPWQIPTGWCEKILKQQNRKLVCSGRRFPFV